MGQVQLSDRQSRFIFYLVHQGKGRTESARLAGFAAPTIIGALDDDKKDAEAIFTQKFEPVVDDEEVPF